MLDLSVHLERLRSLIWSVLRHVATITPAASLWVSGVGLGKYQRLDGSIWIVALAVLIVSSGASAIIYRPAFARARFGCTALILAMVHASRLLPSPLSEFSLPPLNQAETVLRDYVVQICSWAAAVALATHVPSTRDPPPDVPPAERRFLSSDLSSRTLSLYGPRSISDADMSDLMSDPDVVPLGSDTGSFYFKYMPGPKSQASSRSSTSTTMLSLSGGQQVDPGRAARVQEVIGRVEVLRMLPEY